MFEAADESVAVAESERVAEDGPEDGDQAHHGEALHHGAEDVFSANQAAVEEREAGAGHEQNERGGDEHPGVVGVHLRVLHGLLQSGDLSLCRGVPSGGSAPGLGSGKTKKADKNSDLRKQRHGFFAPKDFRSAGNAGRRK